MNNEIILAIKHHKLWIDSLGEKGKKIDLEEAIIEDGKYKNVCLSQGSIIECSFQKIEIKNWDFYAAMLCSSCFAETIITSGQFVKANLAYTQFLNTRIEYSNFSKSDLSNSIFKNTEIANSKFVNSLLDHVIFEKVNLKNTDFTGAFIENVLFDKDTVMEGIYGLDDIHIKSINIGTVKQPQYIKEQDAIQWLKRRAVVEK